jgi:glycosyltransferase involved in cell wall biosynthesis
VKRLAEYEGVTVTGAVPDVRPYIAKSIAAVVPLKIARGIQNKVLEAMAMGRAVIGSGPALEGLDVAPGVNVLRADAVHEWVRHIADVISDAELRKRLGESARRCVEEKYDWDARMAPLVDLCERLANRA